LDGYDSHCGQGGWARTSDSRLPRPVLYQLSYTLKAGADFPGRLAHSSRPDRLAGLASRDADIHALQEACQIPSLSTQLVKALEFLA
jgi:hypothetical protein